MKVGDLVKNIFTKDVGLITELEEIDYVVVDNQWAIPKSHLEVISESR